MQARGRQSPLRLPAPRKTDLYREMVFPHIAVATRYAASRT